MWFAVLGPLEASRDRDSISLGGLKQRRLFGVLLLRAGTPVPRDELIEAMWGARPLPSADESLDTYVYRLRKVLGRDRLRRVAGAYVLQLEPGELDAVRFEGLVAEAEARAGAGEHRGAVELLTSALGLWRGRAWSDLLDVPVAAAEERRLEDARLGALESRAEAALAAGDGAVLVPELEQLVAEHPLRERLQCALMLALYRAGRQVDALEAFAAARRQLLDELGLEPAPASRELQARILRQDPELGGPTAVHLGTRLRGHRARPVLAMTGLLVALALTAGVVLPGAGRGTRRSFLRAGSSGIISVPAAGTGDAVASALSETPTALGAGAGSIWVADADDGSVTRLSTSSSDVVDRITVGGEPTGVVAGGGAIWVADAVGNAVLRIDPASETVTQRISLGDNNPTALAFGGGRLWVALGADRALWEINPATGLLIRAVSLPLTPLLVAYGAAGVWVGASDSPEIVKLDPGSGAVADRVAVPTGATSLAFAAGGLWMADDLDSTVLEINPSRMRVQATIAVGGDPEALEAGGANTLWVADGSAGTVAQIDARSDRVVRRLPTGGTPSALAAAAGRVWVGVTANSRRHRGGTLVLAAVGPFASFDPAFLNSAPTPQFPGLVYDTLMTFDHTGGSDGLRLVPDLALNIPTPADGGRTYAFRLRPGIRYSDGTGLRAADVRRAFERLFTVRSPGADYYDAIVGAAACNRHPTHCDLTRGIAIDDATRTVTFHLSRPDPEFLDALTEEDYSAPVPPGTRFADTRLHPFPGTGPYQISAASSTEITFVRNPFFHEWSHAAQPAGNPDVIRCRLFNSTSAAAEAVVRGRADWLNGLPPLALDRRLAITTPDQLHSEPLFAVAFFPLNTHLAPFNSVLARRALNLALDRRRIAALWGGPAFATPACQPLAPGLPGFRRYCPYTTDPDGAGVYTGPDVARARRLVDRSGTRGEHVTVWGVPVGPYPPPSVTGYVAAVLRALGYRTTVRLRPFQDITDAMRAHFQMSTDGDWLADYPDPSSYLPLFFACGGGNSNGYVCDPALDREMLRAAGLEQDAPGAADALWGRIDRSLTDQADWVPTVNNRNIDLVSRRLGNYEFNPVWGFLPDQAWVR